MKIFNAGLAFAVIAMIFSIVPALAQSGTGISGGGLWKVVSGALQPINSSWTIGTSSDRVAGVYATVIDGSSIVINGSIPGGVTTPWISATSSVTSTFISVSTTNLRVENASSTFFLSGASAITSATSPIPTSTSLDVNGIPQLFYAFNATNTNCVYWTPGTIRGAWNGGNIQPTITWTVPTGTGDVVWRLGAASLADNSYIGNAFSGPFSYATATAGGGYFRQTDTMSALTVEGATANTPMRFQLCRMAQPGDTFGSDAYMEVITGKYSTPNISD